MKDFKKKFYKKLNVIKTFTKVKNFEFIILVLPSELIQFAHQWKPVHGQMQDVAPGSNILRARGLNGVYCFEEPSFLSSEHIV